MAMISDPEQFFQDGCGRCARFASDACSARLWAEGLGALRALCLNAGLMEAAKWGHPCYIHAGRNIAILGAFRSNFRLTFFNAALLDDRTGILAAQGADTKAPDSLHFTDPGQVAPLAAGIRALLAQAMAHAEAGTKPIKDNRRPDLPVELAAALGADPQLSAAFQALTPGRQKSHILAISGAKTAPTRIARLARLTPLILAGKGALDR